MFLDYVSTLGFLTPDQESGLLLAFPTQTRSIIAAQLTDYLLKETTPLNILSNASHLNLIMECVGHAFGLPIVDVKGAAIIRSVTELYRRWLLDAARPPAVELDEQATFQKIFSHFSLLFALRVEKEYSLELHSELCVTLLEILLSAGRNIGNRYTQETWEHLLKVMLGISDIVLKGSRGQSIDDSSSLPSLGTKLSSLLLKVLFELWLRSNTRNQFLWDSLKELVQGWRYRKTLIDQWANTCIGLTNRVIRILYGPEEGSDVVIVHNTQQGTDDRITLADDFVVYAWHRSLHLIGDLETMPSASNYLTAIQGIRTIVTSLINIGTGPRSFYMNNNINAPKPPDGNTILHIVGNWLFKAVNLKKKEQFDKGVAEALQTLCSIFISKSNTDFLSLYLAQFYRGIEEALARTHYLVDIVLTSCDTLLQQELKGVRVLVPTFLGAVINVMSHGKGSKKGVFQGTSSTPAALRASCIKIMGYLICLPNMFSEIKFELKNGSCQSYSELVSVLEETMLESIKTEENSKNLQSLLWTITSYIYENITSESNFPNNVVSMILSNIASLVWAPEVILTSLQVISELSHLWSIFRKEKGKEASQLIVKTLCELIRQEHVVPSSGNKSGPSEDIASSSFYCIQAWVMTDQWILQDESLLKLLFEIINVGIGYSKQVLKDGVSNDYFPPTPKIKESAEATFVSMMNLVDNFPRDFHGLSSVSCLQTEEDILSTFNLKMTDINWYSFDKHTIVTVIRHHSKEDENPRVTVITRDPSGRYVWNATLNCAPQPTVQTQTYSGESKNVFENPLLRFEHLPDEKLDDESQRFFFYLMGLLEPAEKRRHDLIFEKAKEREHNEQVFLKDKNYGLNYDVQAVRPKFVVADGSPVAPLPTKLFLSHFGFSLLSNKTRFFSLQPLDGSIPNEFLSKIRTLDATKERDTYQIGVLYIAKANAREEEILELGGGSKEFTNFIASMAWPVKWDDHVGYHGNLEHGATGDTIPYYANHECEVVFHIPSIIPSLLHRKRLIASDKVLITWYEENEGPLPLKSIRFDFLVNIFVTPLKSGLYRIRVVRPKSWISLSGPVTDELCVSRHVLGPVVLRTALNYSKMLKEEKSKPFTLRKNFIEEIISTQRLQAPLHQFYGAQFVSN